MKVIVQRPADDTFGASSLGFVNQVFDVQLRRLQSEQNFYVLENFSYLHEVATAQLPILHKGYFDAHLHMIGLGLAKKELDLRPLQTFKELLFFLETVPRSFDGVVKGYGWDQSRWGLSETQIVRAFEEQVPEDVPLFLLRVCGHSALVNQAFKRWIGQPQLATWLGDEELSFVRTILPPANSELRLQAFRDVQKSLINHGITAVSDMSLDAHLTETLRKAASQGELQIDVEGVFLDAPGPVPLDLQNGPWFVKNNINIGPLDRNAIFSLRYWKRYLDGSLGSRTAWLEKPYADGENFGQQLYETSELVRAADNAACLGFGLSFHCIGDGAVTQALDVGEQLKDRLQEAVSGPHSFSMPIRRHRIEHAQVLQDKQLRRMRDQGFWQVFLQPHHRVADEPFVEARLGAERCRFDAYRAQKILAHGVPIALSSDAPIDDFNPHLVIRAAMDHPNPEERLSFDQALWWYTTGSRLSAGLFPGVLKKGSTVFLTTPL